MEELPHLEPGPNPTSKELLRGRERAVAKETEYSAAEMNQSRIEELHAQQELVLANPVCFAERDYSYGTKGNLKIMGQKEISKLVVRV